MEIETVDEWMTERYTLAKERIREIPGEKAVPQPFSDFFCKMAGFLEKGMEQ